MGPPTIFLASGSPRRRELLTTLGLPFEAAGVDADERHHPGEPVGAYLERVVDEKLRLAEVEAARRGLDVVLVADTVVVLDGRPLGKPADEADNAAMLRALAGRSHQVLTRFALVRRGASSCAETVATDVRFRELGADEIAAYVATGEGRDKAGGYAVQGLGGFAVAALQGSYSNVVGLPVCELVVALRRLGVVDVFPLAAGL
ncbi:MAG: Maf family nucleotide pyrophosphatase [Polyangiaceae bacterium]|jgi:septum formation protein|nr:Maf family nucleotide pyrophosphatase [Polyangiaceae bacterium]